MPEMTQRINIGIGAFLQNILSLLSGQVVRGLGIPARLVSQTLANNFSSNLSDSITLVQTTSFDFAKVNVKQETQIIESSWSLGSRLAYHVIWCEGYPKRYRENPLVSAPDVFTVPAVGDLFHS